MRRTQTPITATRPTDLKLSNRMQILELFKSGDTWTAGAIAQVIGISRQTVMKAIQFFVEKGIIVCDGKADSTSVGGKRAAVFSLSANRYLINVLFSPDALCVSLFNFRCEILDTCAMPMLPGTPLDAAVETAGNTCRQMLARHRVEQSDLRGVCISTSGIVDRGTNHLKFNSLMPNWGKDIPIAEKLAAFFDNDILMLVENVGKVCGSAFLHDSQFQNMRCMTLFSSWDGVCACLMERGRILSGKDSLIGEIGHMFLNPADTEVCGCGCRGCFERQVSVDRIRGMVRQALEAQPESALAGVPLDALTISDVFAASRGGDACAQAISRRLAEYFALALKNITLLFNPDVVVFQGDYANLDATFLDTLNRVLSDFHYYGSNHPFHLQMDPRPIQELSTIGAYTLLIDLLFSDEATYG